MNQHQELEKIKSETNASFGYGHLHVYMRHGNDPTTFLIDTFEPLIEVFWRDVFLGRYGSLQMAVTETFNAVRVCRPGIAENVNEDRTALLLALSALGQLVGVELHGGCDTPEMETRMHLEDDRLRDVFKHWDDRPQVTVFSSVSNKERHNYSNEGIKYRIRMSTFANTFTHEVTMPSWELVDLNELLVTLMIKHFA